MSSIKTVFRAPMYRLKHFFSKHLVHTLSFSIIQASCRCSKSDRFALSSNIFQILYHTLEMSRGISEFAVDTRSNQVFTRCSQYHSTKFHIEDSVVVKFAFLTKRPTPVTVDVTGTWTRPGPSQGQRGPGTPLMRGNGKAAAPWGDAHDLQPRALAASPAAAVVDSRCARETGWARPACACARAHTHTHTHTHTRASE